MKIYIVPAGVQNRSNKDTANQLFVVSFVFAYWQITGKSLLLADFPALKWANFSTTFPLL